MNSHQGIMTTAGENIEYSAKLLLKIKLECDSEQKMYLNLETQYN